MTDIKALAERLRQIAESQRMDFDSPHVALTLDESAATIEAQEAKIAEALAEVEKVRRATFEGYWVDTVQAFKDIRRILSADAPTVPAPELEREDDTPSGVAAETITGSESRAVLTVDAMARSTGMSHAQVVETLNAIRSSQPPATEDVRELLVTHVRDSAAWRFGAPDELADAILARFHVTPKGQSNG